MVVKAEELSEVAWEGLALVVEEGELLEALVVELRVEEVAKVRAQVARVEVVEELELEVQVEVMLVALMGAMEVL